MPEFPDKIEPRNYRMICDWDLYLKRHNLPQGTKIFICFEYLPFKKALIERGWHENKDYFSPIFHLKFTVKSSDIFKIRPCKTVNGQWAESLQDYQIVNHFYQSSHITQKVGLTQSLKNLQFWSNEIEINEFYPKCFVVDLG